MKTHLLIFSLIVFFLFGCAGNSATESDEHEIIGKWHWVESTGGIAGWTLTPENQHYNQQMTFEADSSVSLYRADTLYFKSTFSIKENKLTFENYSFSQHFTIHQDTLTITEACADCYQHIYRRETPKVRVIIAPNLSTASLSVDPFTIVNTMINANKLNITVRYGGGCRDHEFILYTNGAFMESYPVQLNLFLTHNANGDRCKALLTETLQFDLSPLKDAYSEGYQTTTGTIKLRIIGSNNTIFEPIPEYIF